MCGLHCRSLSTGPDHAFGGCGQVLWEKEQQSQSQGGSTGEGKEEGLMLGRRWASCLRRRKREGEIAASLGRFDDPRKGFPEEH